MLTIKRIYTTAILASLLLLVKAQNDSTVVYNFSIEGTVYDAATKKPIEGLNVAYSDKTSAFTDSMGYFNISIPDNQVAILVTGSGYETQIVPVKKRGKFEVYLHEENYLSFNQTYNEYYQTKSLAFTPKSVESINYLTEGWKSKAISVEEELQNSVSGLNVISKSGMPGIGSHIYLRGFTSLYGSNQPLIVVDGFALNIPKSDINLIGGFQQNVLAFIDVADIEDISIIKDASTIYGSQAGGGVIFIKTRRSQDVATQISFNTLTGVNDMPKHRPMMEADDYKRYLNEILQSSGLNSDSIATMPHMITDLSDRDYYKYNNNTNWQDEIFQEGVFQKYNLSISGGDNVALYNLSVGFTDHEGVLKNTGFNRYNARFNSDIQVSPKFTMNAGVNFAFCQYTLKEEGMLKTSPIHQSLVKAPFLFPNMRTSNGVVSPILENFDEQGISNPRSIMQNLNATSDNYQIFGLFNLSYQLTDNITISDQVGIDFRKLRDNLFVPHHGIAPDTLELGIAENKMSHQVYRSFNLGNDFRLNYNQTLNSVHNIAAIAGFRVNTLNTEDDWAQSHNSPNDEMKTIDFGLEIFRSIGGSIYDITRMTYYLSGEYNYANRYLVSLNMALDGASDFGKETDGLNLFGGTFGLFPSVAAAWLVSSESFMSEINAIDLLKIRASYGKVGNSNFSSFPAMKSYVSQNFIGSQGLVKGSLWTPLLQWETVNKINLGADIGVLKNKVVLSVDYYSNTTSDMLNVIEADPLSGFSFYIDNDGSFQSKGIDISAFVRAIDGQNLKLDFTLNYSKYETEILELPINNKVTSIYDAHILSSIGQPLGLFYGYKAIGVYSTQAQAEADGKYAVLPNTDLAPFGAGDVNFYDLNGDKTIDENDMQVIGDPNPDFTGMFSSKITWKGISLEAAVSFVSGQDVFNHLRYQIESSQNVYNQSQAVLNRWKSEGQLTDFPKATYGDPLGNSRFSDRWIEDGSFLRLKYVTVTYDIPWHPAFIRGLEVFASGHNLLTISKYLGYDPEFSVSEFSLAQGIDIGLTPQVRSVYGGIKINF